MNQTTVYNHAQKGPGRCRSMERFRIRLAQNLENGPHALELAATGDGPVEIDAFEVFEPPLK